MPIQWREQLSVGNTAIDDEHKHLLCLLNGIEVLLKRHVSRDPLIAFLDELLDYTQQHFSREEDIMIVAKYPGYTDHKLQHEQLIEELSDIRADIVASDSEATLNQRVVNLMETLKRWLIDHIMKEDKAYSAYLKR